MSCAVQKMASEQYVPGHLYELNISYDDKERAFLLKLTSQANEEICIPEMSWTDEDGGHYFFGDRQVYFVNDGVRYDIKDVAFSDYCTSLKVNGCINILKKNEQIFGKIPIEDFVVPSETYLSKNFNPQLHYPYAPRFCTVRN